MNKYARLLASAALVASTVVVSFAQAGVAHAGVDAKASTKARGSYTQGAGHATFRAYGEHFYLYDRVADGAGVQLEVAVNGKLVGRHRNTKGAGTETHYNYSIPEGAMVHFLVCLIDNGDVIDGTCAMEYPDAEA